MVAPSARGNQRSIARGRLSIVLGSRTMAASGEQPRDRRVDDQWLPSQASSWRTMSSKLGAT